MLINPYNKQKSDILKNTKLSIKEQEQRIEELRVDEEKWLQEQLDKAQEKILTITTETIKDEKKLKKGLDKKELRLLYKKSVHISRQVKDLYAEVRMLNKEVREKLGLIKG